MKRKRAPGGGRKPIGAAPARSLVTIRMPDDVRETLESEARKHGWSLTQELLSRVRASITRDRDDRALRAIYFLVSELARKHLYTNAPDSRPWHRDPFRFKAFRLGVARVLAAIQPPGEVTPPPFYGGKEAVTPASEADRAANELLRHLFYAAQVELNEDFKAKIRSVPGWGEWMIDALRLSLNEYPKIRQDLGIEAKQFEGSAAKDLFGNQEEPQQ
jgi:hypothetical protein